MKCFSMTGMAVLLGVILVAASSPMLSAATRTFDFDTPEYGTADENCINNPVPPLFNRPEYGFQTGAYIVDPAACGQGASGISDGSDSILTHFFSVSPPNNNELRFSWVNPADDNTWLRVYTFAAAGVAPKFQSPTVYLGVGSKISMDIGVFGTNGAVGGDNEVPGGGLEFSLAIRETGKNLPLGENGGIDGTLEFVGIDSKGGPSDTNTPVGGVRLNSSETQTIVWEFVDAGGGQVGVQVTVGGNAPVVTGIVGFTGDNVLSAANSRGTLDSLIIRKPASDDTTKKWFVNIDNVVIDAPGVTDPVQIVSPVSVFNTTLTVRNIDSLAERVTLYANVGVGPVQIATVTAPPEDFSSGSFTFSNLALTAGSQLTATQTVGTVESSPSDPVTVGDKLCLTDFANGVAYPRTPAGGNDRFGEWYEVNGQAFATVRAGTLNGSPSLEGIDGGFMNGFYAIYEGVVPADADDYQVTAKIHITEGADVGAIRQYQMGVVVNGVHRDTTSASSAGSNTYACHNQSLLAVDTSLPGNAVGNYVGLTTGNDSGLGTQSVTTGPFAAQAGDNILVVFSTNVQTQWKNVGLEAGTGRLDTLDPCETPAGFPPVPTPVPNEQGTWNVTATRANTSGGWGAGAVVRVDDICLIKIECCTLVPPVIVQTPLVQGQTSVTVTGVDPTATVVKVYANGMGPAIGSAAGNGTDTVTVTVPALACNAVISATQTIDVGGDCGPTEGCVLTSGPKVCDCNQIPTVLLAGPLNAGVTTVTVTGVDVDATAIHVYETGAPPVLIGQLTTGVVEGDNVVTVTPMVKGRLVTATQTIATLEGCVVGGQVVGSGGNSGLLLSLGIRQTNPTGNVGEDGGLNSTEIEWIVDPNSTATGAPPPGKLIQPGLGWQTVTFDPINDRIINFSGGNGGFDGQVKGVLEHLAVSADPNSLDVGPYTMYIDNITSGGVNFADFEAIAAGQQAVFRQPSFSGSSGPHIAAPPNASEVDDTKGDASEKSVRIEWRFLDESATRWIRVTTNGTANIPNPIIDLTQPITMRVLLLPNLGCNTPWADADDDGDVDASDFAIVQACISGLDGSDAEATATGDCACFDRNSNQKVDQDDIANFAACGTGPGVVFDPQNPPVGCVP